MSFHQARCKSTLWGLILIFRDLFSWVEILFLAGRESFSLRLFFTVFTVTRLFKCLCCLSKALHELVISWFWLCLIYWHSDQSLAGYIINFPSLPFCRFLLGFLTAMLLQNVKCGLYTYNIYSENFHFLLFFHNKFTFWLYFQGNGQSPRCHDSWQ